MRVGQNPLRGSTVTSMPDVVASVITHLPNQDGYHRGRFEVVKTCLTTMRENAGVPISVYVWDNGSSKEFRKWLTDEYEPDYLTLSPNVGKASARSAIIRTFPPETIVGVSDDDMLYYKDWILPQIELLESFPNVGVVSGYPVRTQFRWGTSSTVSWAKTNAKLSSGKFISEEYDRDFCTSIGRDYKDHLKMTESDLDYLVEYNGRRAYATAHHCQFVCYAGSIEFIVEWNNEAMSDEKNFDRAVDAQGLLRLTTVKRVVRHIGNRMEPELAAQAKRLLEA